MINDIDDFEDLTDRPDKDLEALLESLEVGVEEDDSETILDEEMATVIDEDLNVQLFDMLFVTHANAANITALFGSTRKPDPNLLDDERSPYPRTALTRLIADGRYELAEQLMEFGADPNNDSQGAIHPLTVLCYPDDYKCRFTEREAVVRIIDSLFRSNATTDVLDEDGRTPFEHAIHKASETDEHEHYEGLVKGLSVQTIRELNDARCNPSESLRTIASLASRDADQKLPAFREVILRTEQVLAKCNYSRKQGDSDVFSPLYLSLLHSPDKSCEEVAGQLQHYSIKDVQEFCDVLDEFSIYVLVPAMYLQSDKATRSKLGRIGKKYPLVEHLRPLALECLFSDRSVDGVLGMAKGWHQPRYFFPQELRPLSDGDWHTIIDDQQIPDGHDLAGYSVKCLNTSVLLKQEGNEMNHCIGGQDNECLEGRMHAFSIRDSEGNALSTFDLSIIDIDEYKRTSHRSKDEYIVIDKIAGPVLALNEHKAKNNRAPSDEAKKVFAWLKQEIEADKISVHDKQVGETDGSASRRARGKASSLEKMIGFHMRETDLRKAFAHFQTVKGKRPRDDGDFRDTKDRLIAGNYQPTDNKGASSGPPEPFRRMDAIEWIEKKGLKDRLAKVSEAVCT